VKFGARERTPHQVRGDKGGRNRRGRQMISQLAKREFHLGGEGQKKN